MPLGVCDVHTPGVTMSTVHVICLGGGMPSRKKKKTNKQNKEKNSTIHVVEGRRDGLEVH